MTWAASRIGRESFEFSFLNIIGISAATPLFLLLDGNAVELSQPLRGSVCQDKARQGIPGAAFKYCLDHAGSG